MPGFHQPYLEVSYLMDLCYHYPYTGPWQVESYCWAAIWPALARIGEHHAKLLPRWIFGRVYKRLRRSTFGIDQLGCDRRYSRVAFDLG